MNAKSMQHPIMMRITFHLIFFSEWRNFLTFIFRYLQQGICSIPLTTRAFSIDARMNDNSFFISMYKPAWWKAEATLSGKVAFRYELTIFLIDMLILFNDTSKFCDFCFFWIPKIPRSNAWTWSELPAGSCHGYTFKNVHSSKK